MEKWGTIVNGHGQLRFKVLKAAKGEATLHEVSPSSSCEKDQGEELGAYVIVELLRGQSSYVGGIPGLIQLLETNRNELGLEYYYVSPATLDEVFLRVIGEEEEETSVKGKHVGGLRKLLKFPCF